MEPEAIRLTRDGYTGVALLAALNTAELTWDLPRTYAGYQMREFFEEEGCGDGENGRTGFVRALKLD